MPFKSQAQRGYMYIHHPEIAKEFEKATPKGTKLPEHVKMKNGGTFNPIQGDFEGLKKMFSGAATEKGSMVKHDMGGVVTKHKNDVDEAEAEIEALEKGPQSPSTVSSSTDTPKGYADGGEVDDSQLPTPEPNTQDKLQAVLQAMGMGAKAAVAPIMPSDQAPTTPAPAALNPAGAQLPVAPVSAAPVDNSVHNLQDIADNAPPHQPAPSEKQDVKPTSAAPATSSPTSDILDKLTDGDSSKMSALLQQLQDQNKRSQFAQALAVIGDTFGNMGQAKAGQTPSGITTPQLIQGMTEKNRAASLENLTQQLAADPNSQTSKMAQMVLAQSMGIKQGDPRMAKISSMPAQSITQLIPQMTDAVKNNIEKEKNLITAKQAEEEHQARLQEIAVNQANAQRQLQGTLATASNEALKNLSPLNPANTAVRTAAQQNLTNTLGGPGAGTPITATNKMGHKIISHDGGRSWQPAQ